MRAGAVPWLKCLLTKQDSSRPKPTLACSAGTRRSGTWDGCPGRRSGSREYALSSAAAPAAVNTRSSTLGTTSSHSDVS